MSNHKKQKNLDDLIEGVKAVLSKDRSSFTDEEFVLSNQCLNYLQEAQCINQQTNEVDIGLVSKAVEILVRLFVMIEKLKDLL